MLAKSSTVCLIRNFLRPYRSYGLVVASSSSSSSSSSLVDSAKPMNASHEKSSLQSNTTEFNEKKASDDALFALIRTRGLVTPSFDIQRRIGNTLSQFVYQRFFEEEYTNEGFLNGITEAAILCGQYIADGNWDRLGAIMTSDAVDDLRERYETLNEQQKSKLRFTFDDVICTFLHSTFIAGRRIFKISKPSNFAFYGIAVLYIRLDKSINMNEAPQKLLQNSSPGTIMISNVTIRGDDETEGYVAMTE